MRHHYVVPYGPYLASDGVYVNVAVATPHDWEVFCNHVIERPDLLEDARFQTTETRRANRAVLEDLVEKIFLERPHQEWLRRLEACHLPYGQVRGIAQVLSHPQLLARQMVQTVDSPVGPVPVIASPLRLTQSPPRLDRIPALGQDTAAILQELGYAAGEIQQLRNDRVIS